MAGKRSIEQTELSFFMPGSSAEAPSVQTPEASPPPIDPPEVRPSPAPRPTPPSPEVYSVGALVRGANTLLEGRFASVWVEGEIVGLKMGGTGHAFFTLKDEEAALPTAMWRSSVERLRFRLEDGQQLRVRGRLGIFAKQGRFQLYADRAEPAGLGALMLELEQRKKKLAAEGLFDPDRKRPLPAWPHCIGVVTSAHGAAFHDIVQVARRRRPGRILLSPAVVQGQGAAASVRRALARLLRCPQVDVIIVGRGGGAMEDLWAFNDEDLARDIAASPVPIVSAVGHEVDVTICDLVADVRAATPSQAAELVVPELDVHRERLEAYTRRMTQLIERGVLDRRAAFEQAQTRLRTQLQQRLGTIRARLRGAEKRLAQHHPQVRCARDRRRLHALIQRLHTRGQSLARPPKAHLEQLRARLVRAAHAMPRRGRLKLESLEARLHPQGPAWVAAARLRLGRAASALDALSPLAVLQRGFAVVTTDDGVAVCDSATLEPGQRVHVRLHRGQARAQVLDTDDEDR